MNKKCIAISFIVLLLGLSFVNLLIPQRKFSENENRYLQQMPPLSAADIASGKFTKDFEKFTSDQFMGRDGWISMKTLAELGLLKKDNGRVYFGKKDTLFDAGEEINEKQLIQNTEAIVSFIQSYKKQQPSLHASVLLVPTASAIWKDRLPSYAPVPNQAKAMRTVANLLGDHAAQYDPTELFLEHKEEYLYYRTDHHWTTDAAFLAYTGWARKNGLEPLPYEAFSVEDVSDAFFGTTYSKANLPTVKPDTIKAYTFLEPIEITANYGKDTVSNSLYNKDFLLEKDKYSYFLGGNQPEIVIHTQTKNQKTLLLVQDSYAHCFVPFLTAHYEKILVVDPRYLNVEYINYAVENQVTDMLVLYNMPNFSVDKNVSKLAK